MQASVKPNLINQAKSDTTAPHSKGKGIILIPARYQSTRFPGKPLAFILGKSMIQRVYENCQQSGLETYVVTDSDQIEDHVRGFEGNVCRVDDDAPSGSVRIALAYERFFAKKMNYSCIINVQGDEPLLGGEEIKKFHQFFEQHQFSIGTMVKEREGHAEDFLNPHLVKTIFDEESKRCHYFSRSPIPYQKIENNNEKNVSSIKWYQHVGLYAYSPQSLITFAQGPTDDFYEQTEKLEQLRALRLNLTIGAMKTSCRLIGVDTPQDIAKIEGVLRGTL